jgi:ribosome biogenesis GTPase
MFLESLGADESVRRLFQAHAARGLVLARVGAVERGHYHLLIEDGELIAEASGAFRHRSAGASAMPATGDWVAARVVGPGQALVEAVLARKSLFARRAAGKREDQQPIAANVDLVLVICGLDGDFNPRRVERYLALANVARVESVIVLNKADLCDDVASRVLEMAQAAPGTPILTSSTRTPEGLDQIRSLLAFGRTLALLGSSGVGKSAIINCILGEDRRRTQEVRKSDSRGRHATTTRELIPLPGGGALIDTPGMRELQLWAGPDNLEQTFDDIARIARECRFRDCSHSGEPDCAVAEAISEGALRADRIQSYRKLAAEARRHIERGDAPAAASRKKKDKALAKRIRAFYREDRA